MGRRVSLLRRPTGSSLVARHGRLHDFDHAARDGRTPLDRAVDRLDRSFRARRNLHRRPRERRGINPNVAGVGDLFQTTNDEVAGGVTSSYRFARARLGEVDFLVVEPGIAVRGGTTDQSRSLLDPSTLLPWDRRLDDHLRTLDAAGYVDLDLRLGPRLRVSGGARTDLLAVAVVDRLAGINPADGPASRSPSGAALSPRVTAQYDVADWVTPSVSYGEGFRSLDAGNLKDGDTPYSKVRSVEAGVRSRTRNDRITATVAAFETWVANELVFEAAAGGLTTENASVRRGIVGSTVVRPAPWLLASSSLSVTSATFATRVAGVSHDVPSVPPVVWRVDLIVRGRVVGEVQGRIGVGYTYLSGRPLTDAITGPATNALNAGGALRWRWLELGVDGYNVLNLHYAGRCPGLRVELELPPRPAARLRRDPHYCGAAGDGAGDGICLLLTLSRRKRRRVCARAST